MTLKTQLDALFGRATDASDVPGLVALATDRTQTLYEAGFGTRVAGKDIPMTADTVVLIASMTKAVTGCAAMQLVEQERLDLDVPAERWLPMLGEARVLEGFDEAGQPRMRPPKTPITMRHLLTHTAGFSYEFIDADVTRYRTAKQLPNSLSGKFGMLDSPLMFDPGTQWRYGISLDMAGRIVEEISGLRLGDYFAEHIFKPLGITSTAFRITPEMRARLATIHHRLDDGSLVPGSLEVDQNADFDMGGAGLYGTAADYAKFIRMLLNGGQGDHGRVLKAETVTAMFQPQMNGLVVPSIVSADRTLSNDLPLPPELPHHWGLSFLLNSQRLPTGRSPGSAMWAGLANTYYWIDPAKGIGGIFLSQILPFADPKSLPLFLGFEATVYANH